MLTGLGGKILKSFGSFEEEPTDNKQTVTQQPTAAGVANVTTSATQAGNIADTVNAEMVASLQKVIEKRQTKFTSLLESANKLVGVIDDEPTRIIAAFKMIQTPGERTLDIIQQAIVIHQTDLDGELARFEQATKQNMQTKVGALRTKATACANTRDGTLANIAILEKQIADQRISVEANDKQILELTAQADATEQEIAVVAQSFEAAVIYVKRNLDSKNTQLLSVLK